MDFSLDQPDHAVIFFYNLARESPCGRRGISAGLEAPSCLSPVLARSAPGRSSFQSKTSTRICSCLSYSCPHGLGVGLLVIQLGVGNACLRAVLGMRSSRGDAGSIDSHVSCGESSPSLARVLSEAEDAQLSSSCPCLGPQKHQICGAHQLTSEVAGYSRKAGHGSSAAM